MEPLDPHRMVPLPLNTNEYQSHINTPNNSIQRTLSPVRRLVSHRRFESQRMLREKYWLPSRKKIWDISIFIPHELHLTGASALTTNEKVSLDPYVSILTGY